MSETASVVAGPVVAWTGSANVAYVSSAASTTTTACAYGGGAARREAEKNGSSLVRDAMRARAIRAGTGGHFCVRRGCADVNGRVQGEPTTLHKRKARYSAVQGVAEQETCDDLWERLVEQRVHRARLRVGEPGVEDRGEAVHPLAFDVGLPPSAFPMMTALCAAETRSCPWASLSMSWSTEMSKRASVGHTTQRGRSQRYEFERDL